MKTKKPLLTISLLISNRPDTIPRCLDSLRPIMEAIPSELILIDTSKNEEIHKLLLEYTDQVYEFEWCQDFAKARNEGVRRAKGEWFLYLDDDEWFVEIEELLKFFKTGKYKKYGSANIKVRNFSNPEYTKYTDGWVTRLFYLDGETRFEGRVHEYIYHLYGKQAFLEVIANHSGYIYVTEEKLRQHFERNSKILLEVIEKEPDVLRWQAQMVQEYETVREWETIVTFCQEQIKKRSKIYNFMDKNHFCTLYAGLVEALLCLERYKESLAVCEKAMKDERSTELLKALLYMRKAENYFAMGKWDMARIEIEKYLECYKAFDPNEPAMQEQLGTLLVQRTFEKNNVAKAYRILIDAELESGKIDTLFVQLIKDAVRDEDMRDVVCEKVQKWEEREDEAFFKLADIIAQTDSNFWYICYCRVIVADLKNDKRLVEKTTEELLRALKNVFYLPAKVYDIVDKHDIKVAEMWDKIASDKWITQINQFAASCSNDLIDKVYSFIRDIYEREDWRALSLEVAFMEKQIIAGPQEEIVDYYDLLKNYADIKLVVYHDYCAGKEVSDSISADVQAAKKILEYIEIDTKDEVLALRKLKEAAEIYPAFADGLGCFLQRYVELENQRKQSQNDEMGVLRAQVLMQVRSMVENGQFDAALQILQQLKQMFPGDIEIEQLVLEIRENL